MRLRGKRAETKSLGSGVQPLARFVETISPLEGKQLLTTGIPFSCLVVTRLWMIVSYVEGGSLPVNPQTSIAQSTVHVPLFSPLQPHRNRQAIQALLLDDCLDRTGNIQRPRRASEAGNGTLGLVPNHRQGTTWGLVLACGVPL